MRATLTEAFESFKQDALRLECLSAYSVDEERDALAALAAGREVDMSFIAPWHDHLDRSIAQGKSHRRLRLVSDPLSAYEAFELERIYPLNTQHGETIRTLPRQADVQQSDDYWIFDHHEVFRMRYAENGSFVEAVAVPPEVATNIVVYVEDLYSKAEPLS